MREIILDIDPDLKPTVKYKMPCFTYKNNHFCYLWMDKKTHEPYILFVDGNLIEHSKLEKGDRSRMKVFRMKAEEDIPIKTVRELIQKGIELRNQD